MCVVWCGMVWFGVVWCGNPTCLAKVPPNPRFCGKYDPVPENVRLILICYVKTHRVWFGMVWFGMVRCGSVWSGMAVVWLWHGIGMVWCQRLHIMLLI